MRDMARSDRSRTVADPTGTVATLRGRARSDRRSGTVATLPAEVLTAVHGRLRDGATVTDVAAWLAERGHLVSRSAVGRYVRRWREREAERGELLELAAIVRDMAEAAGPPMLDMAGDLAASVVVAAGVLADRAAMADARAVLADTTDPAEAPPDCLAADRAVALAERLCRLVRDCEAADVLARARREATATASRSAKRGGMTPETMAAFRRAVGMPAEPPQAPRAPHNPTTAEPD